ncbi:Ku protein [Undibacterium sp. Di27W]|uniref:non-homologous end joining protein Ku n=1 Tax=Undibacterium sp. Di27W TaxID=3413036 RepID=UPI003BF2AA54
MAHTLWSGAISFGLVHIPVELHSAVSDNALDLTMLDKRDFSPIGFRRYNKSTGKEVKWEDIVKGYEYKPDEFVVLSEEDLKRANVKATQTIDIQAFVDAADVPLTFYEQPYFLVPGRGGDKVYALLRETLRKAGRIAIAEIVIRSKQHLCALLTIDKVIVLNTLRYSDEIRDTDELKLPAKTDKAVGVSDKEVAMAMSLVEGMTEAWNPAQYKDTYRDDILALVRKKVKARQTRTLTMPETESEEQPRSAQVYDLVGLLQQSLGKKVPAKKTVKAGEKAGKPTPIGKKASAGNTGKTKTIAKTKEETTASASRSRKIASGKPPALTTKAPIKTKASSAKRRSAA